jgi:hypothetical protein
MFPFFFFTYYMGRDNSLVNCRLVVGSSKEEMDSQNISITYSLFYMSQGLYTDDLRVETMKKGR